MTDVTVSSGRRLFLKIKGLQEIGVMIALLALCIGLSLSTPIFMTQMNLLNVIRQSSYIGIMAVGMVFVVCMGDIDLSVGSIMTITNVVSALMLKAGQPIPIAILIGLATGALCGFINGSLSVLLKIPTIIVTLGTLGVFRGIALIMCHNAPVSEFPKNNFFFNTVGGNVLGVPTSAVLMLIVGILGWITITRTVFGRNIQAIGGNQQAARLSGIRIDKNRIMVMVLNGTIAAFAGIIALAFLQSADQSTGPGYELWAIASVIIGGTALTGGYGSVPGAILGALIIYVIRNGLVLLSAPPNTDTAVTGAAIIVAVAIDSFVRHRKKTAKSI